MRHLAIYLDLDGVLADYDAGIRMLGFNPDPAKKNALNRSGTRDPFKRQMYEAIKGTEFYYNLPLMPGALELYQAVAAAEPIILTAAPLFGATDDDHYLNPHWLGAAYHKRRWVEEKLLPFALPYKVEWRGMMTERHYDRITIEDDRFICTTSCKKHTFLGRKHSDHQILIDDRRDNCVRWARAGGVAILHTSVRDSIGALERWNAGNWRETFQQVNAGEIGFIHGLDEARTWDELEAAADRNP